MNYREPLKRFMRDPRTLFDWMYWGVRGIRVLAMKDAFENDEGTLAAINTLSKIQTHSSLPRSDRLEVVGEVVNTEDTQELAGLFNNYGSDKATRHDYFLIYSYLLNGKRNLPLNILEIGLGTNNTNFPSNMGKNGKPGAAERAFRDWAPNAQIYGADIDEGILFEEERIKTFFVDQTKPETLQNLSSHFPKNSFDLIIDDGLHNTWANINTLNMALDLLKPDGFFVVEDIVDKYIPTWEIVAQILSEKYQCQLVKCKTESVFIVNKKN